MHRPVSIVYTFHVLLCCSIQLYERSAAGRLVACPDNKNDGTVRSRQGDQNLCPAMLWVAFFFDHESSSKLSGCRAVASGVLGSKVSAVRGCGDHDTGQSDECDVPSGSQRVKDNRQRMQSPPPLQSFQPHISTATAPSLVFSEILMYVDYHRDC